MHRTVLIKALESFEPRLPKEAATHCHFLNFVKTESRCFDRELEIGHVTGSAWLLSPDLRSVLLTHHRKLDRWLQLGGHADGDSDVLRVAIREAEEESGLSGVEPLETSLFDIDVHEIPARKNDPAHLHFDARFLLRAPSYDFVVSDESNELAWVKIEELTRYSSEDSLLRMHRLWGEWLLR